ncbi:MAG: DUF342 domain-containing protein [Spirochaetota bacterium]|nr:MAG: DUF342 domain-containing protein [Spirochaetota bacterium]
MKGKKSNNKNALDVDAIEDKVRNIIGGIDLPDVKADEASDLVKNKLKNADVADSKETKKERGLEEEQHSENTKLGEEVDYIETGFEEGKDTKAKESDKDGSFTLALEEDFMSVTIELYPSEGNGQPLAMESIKAKLKSMKVVYGVNEELLHKLIEKVEKSKTVKKGIVIARGQPPKEGKEGWIEYKFSDRKDVLFKEKE